MRWDYHSYAYEWMWAASTPVWTLLLAASALELSRGLGQAFPKETGNRTAALCGFLIGMTTSVFASMLAHPQAISRSAVLLTVISRRCIFSGCILAILFQGVYLFIGDAPIMANWRLHRRILLTCMTAIVISLFVTTSEHREFVPWINLLRGISLFGCVAVWVAGLQPAFINRWDGLGSPTEEQIADTIVFNHRQAALTNKHRQLEGLASARTALRER